jgi:hypothetical protein
MRYEIIEKCLRCGLENMSTVYGRIRGIVTHNFESTERRLTLRAFADDGKADVLGVCLHYPSL